jgi:hypothetical protein
MRTGRSPIERGLLGLMIGLGLSLVVGCSSGRDVAANYPDGQLPATQSAQTTTESTTTQEADMSSNWLVGTAWQLIIIDTPGNETIFIDDPDRYLLQFKTDRVMAIQADCNACEGAYSSTGRALVVQVDCPTMGCRPGSRGELYMSSINTAKTFNMSKSGKELYVNFGAQRGVLTFRRL